MINRITEITEQVNAFVFSKDNNAESFRLFFLSRKGIITQLFDDFKGIPNDEKKAVGARLNQLKQRAEEKYQLQKDAEVNQSVDHKTRQDTTLPVYQETPGSFHPLRIVEDRLLDIFFSLGFDLAEGPEIEDDKHNFASLNFAEDHPARDMQDTFYIDEHHVLRILRERQVCQLHDQSPVHRRDLEVEARQVAVNRELGSVHLVVDRAHTSVGTFCL